VETKDYTVLKGIKYNSFPANYNGKTGYWIQSECIFVETDRAVDAVKIYKEKLCRYQIEINLNKNTDALKLLEKELNLAEKWYNKLYESLRRRFNQLFTKHRKS
jgi:hypothetical protein